jgi:hypothetical protein
MQQAHSLLERLPLEILVRIFIGSMEISFVQCSNLIGKALSSPWVISQFVDRLYLVSSPELKRVMSCRFFTPTWWATNRIAFDFGVGIYDENYEERLMLEFPGTLMASPWTDEKVRMWMAFKDMTYDWSFYNSPLYHPYALAGLRQAIVEKNSYMVWNLLRPDLGWSKPHPGMSLEEMKSLEIEPPRWEPCCLLIPQEIVRYAIMECDCVPDIVSILLVQGLYDRGNGKEQGCWTGTRRLLDYYDAQLWAWAEQNGRKGEWLKAMLSFLISALEDPHALENVDTLPANIPAPDTRLELRYLREIKGKYPDMCIPTGLAGQYVHYTENALFNVGIYWQYCDRVIYGVNR